MDNRTGSPLHRENTLTGKIAPKDFPVRENTGNLEMLSKQGILFPQVVNSLILKIQDIAVFDAKFSNLSKSVLLVK